MIRMNVVLFDKDLRITDHLPLAEAAKGGEVLPLYIFQPSQWQETLLSARHFQFVIESLEELSKQINDRGGKLFFAIGELEAVLDKLLAAYDFISLFAHRGTKVTEKAGEWAERNQQRLITYGPDFNDVPAKHFRKQLNSYFKEPVIEVPIKMEAPEKASEILFTDFKRILNFPVSGSKIRFGQQGGELKALETLDSFLGGRFASYVANQQKPLASSFSSSRLSEYITWGNISVRTIFQKTTEKLQSCELEEEKYQLEQFLSKIETRVKICSGASGNKQITDVSTIKNDWDEEKFKRWLDGRTGIPIIDAAMRSLNKTGWLNFTFRSLVTSFIANTLLLDEQIPSKALAQLYLDYEPVLHDFYVKQQTGLTGKVKIINPVKIGKQLDPDGAFIRRYIPELSHIPEEYVHEPWLYPGFYQLGYEVPLVDVKKANKLARQKFQRLKNEGNPGRKKDEGEKEQLSFDL